MSSTLSLQYILILSVAIRFLHPSPPFNKVKSIFSPMYPYDTLYFLYGFTCILFQLSYIIIYDSTSKSPWKIELKYDFVLLLQKKKIWNPWIWMVFKKFTENVIMKKLHRFQNLGPQNKLSLKWIYFPHTFWSTHIHRWM